MSGALPFTSLNRLAWYNQKVFLNAVITATLFMLLALSAAPGHANELNGRQQAHAAIGFNVMDFDYREFNDGERLNHEHGTLFGLSASAGKRWQRYFIEADISWLANSVDYDGQTQNGAPVSTDTEESIVSGAALYGRYFQVQEKLQLALIAGAGYRHWQRDINSTRSAQGVDETYTWWYGQLGVRGVYQSAVRHNWLAEVKLIRPFAAEIDIDFGNEIDNAALTLGEKTSVQLNLAYQFRLTNNWRLDVAGSYTAWDIGRSREGTLRRNGTAIGKVFEPESETRNVGLRVSGAYVF